MMACCDEQVFRRQAFAKRRKQFWPLQQCLKFLLEIDSNIFKDVFNVFKNVFSMFCIVADHNDWNRCHFFNINYCIHQSCYNRVARSRHYWQAHKHCKRFNTMYLLLQRAHVCSLEYTHRQHTLFCAPTQQHLHKIQSKENLVRLLGRTSDKWLFIAACTGLCSSSMSLPNRWGANANLKEPLLDPPKPIKFTIAIAFIQ